MVFEALYRHARRVVIFVFGCTVVLLGLVMLVGPGPGILTIVAGLAILAIEFAWAKRWLDKAKEVAAREAERAMNKIRGKGAAKGGAGKEEKPALSVENKEEKR